MPSYQLLFLNQPGFYRRQRAELVACHVLIPHHGVTTRGELTRIGAFHTFRPLEHVVIQGEKAATVPGRVRADPGDVVDDGAVRHPSPA